METVEKIRYLRLSNHLKQEDVARALNIARSSYSKYESGIWRFTIEHLKKLADFYHVSISYLIEDSDNDILITKEQLNILIKAKEVIEEIEQSLNKSKEK